MGLLTLAAAAVSFQPAVCGLPDVPPDSEQRQRIYAPVGVDDCTRGIALEFVRRPAVAPDVACLARRIPAPFATDGLDELLAQGS